MKIVVRIIAAILFFVIFSFALKNSHEVPLQFFMGYEWRGPMVLLLLVFFAIGATFGVLAMMPTIFRKRNEISKQKTMVSTLQKQIEALKVAQDRAQQDGGAAQE